MISVLIVDQDPFALETISHQLDIRGYRAVMVSKSGDAVDLIGRDGKSFAGLVINVDMDDGRSGWDVARSLREINPTAAIGYLSATSHRDWAINGVPDSVLIGAAGGDHDIPDNFFRLCGAGQPGDVQAKSSSSRLADAIKREQDTLQEHFQRTPSFIAFLEGADHRYVFANQAYIRLVEREVVGLTVVEAFPEVVAQGFVDILDRVYSSGEDFVAHGVEFKISLGLTETKTTYIDLIYRPMHAADGRICGIFVEGEDLTARLATQERISELQNELIYVARINAMGVLASTLAHELNQPLASIQNFVAAAAMLAEKRALDPEFIDYLQGASKNALRAGDIIRRLRAMTVRRSLKREAVALEAALREAVATACTGRHDVRIGYDFRSTGLVRVDPVQLQQVMLNLIRNALESAGPHAPDLFISTVDEGAFVRSCVCDAGTGIDAALLPRIFDAFATSKPEGMGVGLSLCKTIIETHGGKLTARNNEDRGATFCFTLPKATLA